jgi:Ras-related protein Rab-1A
LFVCSGVDYKAKEVKIENEMVKLQVYLILKNQNQFLQIWDTAGQERFRSMTSAFYNKAHGIILVFDVSQEESFRSLNTWIRDIRRV